MSRHLRHGEWDARVAAGHCLGLLAEHFQHHTPGDLAAAAADATALEAAAVASGEDVKLEPKPEDGGSSGGGASAEQQHHLLSFASFDVQQVLAQGTPMLASGGEVGWVQGKAGQGWRGGWMLTRLCHLRVLWQLRAPDCGPAPNGCSFCLREYTKMESVVLFLIASPRALESGMPLMLPCPALPSPAPSRECFWYAKLSSRVVKL